MFLCCCDMSSNGSGFPVAPAAGCLMTMITTTVGTTTYCPEGYCDVGYVWSSADSGKCTGKHNTYQ